MDNISKKALIDNPEWSPGERCVICGSVKVDRHHIFCGTSNRKQSDKHGYVIPLCREHHTGGNGIHRNRGLAMVWMQIAQAHYEKHIGDRLSFINEFGKSYL